MRSLIVALTLAIALLVPAIPSARAQAAADGKIIFVGLRPTDDAALSTTAIRRLTEAQAIRLVTENVIAAISGREVAGHDTLRDALGSGYLVKMVDCKGEPKCIIGLVRPIASRGYRQVVAGDYYVDPETNQYQLRISLLQIDGKAPPVTATFRLDGKAIEDPKAWQVHLDAMFSNRGAVVLKSNVTGFKCTVDGAPCELDAEQRLLVPAGEHVVELSKEGYLPRSRVIGVTAGKTLTVGIGLDALPLQAGAAPNRLVEGLTEAAQGVKVIGRIELNMLFDDVNTGDVIDVLALPNNPQKEWTAAFLPTPTFIGISAAGPKTAGNFQIRGLIVAGVFDALIFRLPFSSVELLREDLGLKITTGRQLTPTVSSATPGTLAEQFSFGALGYTTTGARVSKTFGSILLELGAGRPEVPLKGDNAAIPLSLSPYPYAEGRLAFVSPELSGLLYGQKTPLVISASGAYGRQRFGPGEAAAIRRTDPMAADPVVEDLPSWVASTEFLVPLAGFVLAGEAYLGHGSAPYGGQALQLAQIDPATGRHTQLRSFGGWAQLSYTPAPGWEALVVGGFDRVYDGYQNGGLSIAGNPAQVFHNQMIAAVITTNLHKQLRVGLQLHHRATYYRGMDGGTILGGILHSQFNF